MKNLIDFEKLDVLLQEKGYTIEKRIEIFKLIARCVKND